jgi:hypothetical protein
MADISGAYSAVKLVKTPKPYDILEIELKNNGGIVSYIIAKG